MHAFKFRVLTSHTQFGLHSQFVNIDYIEDFNKKPFVYINPVAAKANNIADGDKVKMFNKVGNVTVKAKLTDNVAEDVILMYEARFRMTDFNVQNLVDDESSDMGSYKTGAPGVAIHHQFAEIVKE